MHDLERDLAAIRRLPYGLKGFRRFVKLLRLEDGKPMVLYPFEVTMLTEHFGGATEVVILIPKKNGKTTLLGALALYHLLMVPFAEVVIGASSRDQATLLYNQAAGLVRRAPGLERKPMERRTHRERTEYEGFYDVKAGYRTISLDDGRIRVLAADANTADGVIPTLALVDELHRHPSGDLYGVFRDGLGARDGQMLTISTAGSTLLSPLGQLRDTAYSLPGFRPRNAQRRTYSRSADGAFVFHEWSLDPLKDDPDDLRLVKLANPAPWQTVKKLRTRHDSPSMTPWQWKRFACGIWTDVEEPWLDPREWDALTDPDMAIEPASRVWVSLRIGTEGAAGIAVVNLDDAPKVRVKAEGFGKNTPLATLEGRIRELGDLYRVEHVVFDQSAFRHTAETLAGEGFQVSDWPHSPMRMLPASTTLYEQIQSGNLVHDGDPALRAQVLAGIKHQTPRGWYVKEDPKSNQSAAMLEALASGVHVALLLGRSAEPMVAWR